ncbi:hypothetical protein [Nioella aestuarii]|uniref:VHL beta domain-containing protein n=1 Tax=Nioella aestuarii TaxID=1662864 RepID=UPI003D7F48DC
MKVLGMSALLALAGWVSCAAAQGMDWVYTNWTPVPGQPPSISLDYGVAYSDAVQFSLNCNAGSAGTMVHVDFFSAIGPMSHGGPVIVSVMSPGQPPIQIPSEVFSWETGHTGARAELPISHPFFSALQGWSGLSFQLAGQQTIALPADQGRDAIASFVADCSAIVSGAGPSQPGSALSCDTYGSAYSVSGHVPQQVTFFNEADAARVLFWIDYQGQPIQIAIVEPGLWVTIDSFLTHPWLITDMGGLCRQVMEPQSGQDCYEISN